MSQHNKTDFNHFTKEELDLALSAHHLPANKPSQLADSFRNGAEWAAGYSKERLARQSPLELDLEPKALEPIRDCTTCKHWALSTVAEPCSACSTYNPLHYTHWEPEHGPI